MGVFTAILSKIAPEFAATRRIHRRRRELHRRVLPRPDGHGPLIDGLNCREFVPLLRKLTEDWSAPIDRIDSQRIAENESRLIAAIQQEARDPREAKRLTGLPTALKNLENLLEHVKLIAEYHRVIGKLPG